MNQGNQGKAHQTQTSASGTFMRVLGTLFVFGALGPFIGVMIFHGGGVSHVIENEELLLAYLIGGPFAVLIGALCAACAVVFNKLPWWLPSSIGVGISFLSIVTFRGLIDISSEDILEALPLYVFACAIASTFCGALGLFFWRKTT